MPGHLIYYPHESDRRLTKHLGCELQNNGSWETITGSEKTLEAHLLKKRVRIWHIVISHLFWPVHLGFFISNEGDNVASYRLFFCWEWKHFNHFVRPILINGDYPPCPSCEIESN